LGNAQTEGGTSAATRLSIEPFDRAVTKLFRNAATRASKFILFEQFQIELPPIGIGIMLSSPAPTGGCRPIPKSELPP
jgi:hypothetical protein